MELEIYGLNAGSQSLRLGLSEDANYEYIDRTGEEDPFFAVVVEAPLDQVLTTIKNQGYVVCVPSNSGCDRQKLFVQKISTDN